jgi:hypothetical protein
MHVFSPERANALIPVLMPLIEQLWEKRVELAIRLLESDPALHSARSATPRRPARRFTDLKAEVVQLINRIEAYGCVVKDIDLGLLDFPSIREGKPVYLCWKAGESELLHWHGTDETFRERKPLE